MFRSIIFLLLLPFSLCHSAEWVDYPGYDIPGYGRKVVLISGDQEYRSEETLPQLGKILAQHHGFDCRVLFTQSPKNLGIVDPEYSGPKKHIPGLEALKTADLLILGIRFLDLPDDQMSLINDYLISGRPVLGLRTSNHGFNIPKESKWAHYHWEYEGPNKAWRGGFGQIIFGGKFIDHHGWKLNNSTRGILSKGKEDLPVLQGLDDSNIWGPSFVYGINTPLRENCDVLVYGQVLKTMEPDSEPLGPGPYEHSPKSLSPEAKGKNDPMMPIAWTTEYQIPNGRRGLAYHTTLGASQDFESEGVRRLIVNGAYWLMGINPKQGGTNVDIVGDFKTTEFEFRKGNKWQERGLEISSFEHTILPKGIELPEQSYLNPKYGRKGKLYADHPVNRFRFYDFYTRQAEAMMDLEKRPSLLPDFPALDGGHFGHWGAYHKNSYDDQRHNSAAQSSAIAASFNPDGHRQKAKLSRVIAFRLSDDISCAFDAETLNMIQVWEGDFIRFHAHRWGLGDGMEPKGKTLHKKNAAKQQGEFLGYYQNGDKNVIEYRLGKTRVLEYPWAAKGKFFRTLEFPDGVNEPITIHTFSEDVVIKTAKPGETFTIGGDTSDSARPSTLIAGGPDLWPWKFEAKGKLNANTHGPYVHDEIPVPDHNPYGAPMLLGGVSFFTDGRAAVTSMNGDVWIVSGLDETLEKVVWKRFASGLNHALGVEVIDNKIIVLGRDRLTRLHDLNQDGMADYYENFSQAFEPSHGGHSFYVGLQRDAKNNLYFTGSTHTIKVSADGKTSTTLNAGGQRNPDGVGVSYSGIVLSSANEGDWNPASFIFEVKEGDFYGRGAKANGPPVAPPLAFVPRGIDNSTGSQIFVEDDRWGMKPGTIISTSFGSGTIYGVLRDTHWSERAQGAVFPLPFDFKSGTHRGRFSPVDGQLYLVGVDGWGNYAITDGHLDRIRYTGGEVVQPSGWTAYKNGLKIELHSPLDPASVKPENFLLQQWHYEYSEAYGCRERSVKNPDVAGHDEVAVSSVKLSDDGKYLLIGIPDIHPVECLHVHGRLTTAKGEKFLLDTFHTLLHLDEANPELPPRNGEVADTLKLDIKFVLGGRDLPWTRNRFKEGTQSRTIKIQSLAGLKFDETLIEAKAGEALQINFKNIDPLMPHNLVFVKPGTMQKIGMASNQLLSDPAAAAKEHYVPKSDDVLFHTSVLTHNRQQTLYVNAPKTPGDYPFLCTFPGHWGVMNGILRVK